MRRLFVSAGDPSGDLLAARLIERLNELAPDLEVWAVGGRELAGQSDVFLEDLASKGIMGFLEPVRRLPYLTRLGAKIKAVFAERNFDLAIPVDYYGFNIRVAQIAKKRAIPVIYYVCPQIWASREGRARQLKKYVDRILCLFPFEPAFLRKRGIEADFVGHPLVQSLRLAGLSGAAASDGQAGGMTIGLLPGSRPQEIKRHLPVLISAFKFIRQQQPAARAVLYSRPGLEKLYPGAESLRQEGIDVEPGPAWENRSRLTLALTASGLATLENMVMGVPMVIFYGVKPAWVYWLGRRMIKTPFIGMPNILAGKKIVPEIAWGMNESGNLRQAREIAASALGLLNDKDRRDELKRQFANLAETLLGEHGNPVDAAAGLIMRALSGAPARVSHP